MAISKLEYDTARNCVREFDTISSEMRSTFSELKREMDSLEDDLKSRGGDTLYAKYKDLRTNVNNGITLCELHHSSMVFGSFHQIYGNISLSQTEHHR